MMIKANFYYLQILFSCIITINLICGNLSDENNFVDFFYNVDFSGPLFDQAVYTTSPKFSISSPINTEVFKFIVKPRTDFNRPSFLSKKMNHPTNKIRSEDITVTSNNSNFRVVHLVDDSYALVTNTFPLNYFSPFNRYLFKLVAKQKLPNLISVSSTAQVQINLENDNVHDPVFIPNNQIFYISETTQPGAQFGTVYASDPDNDEITYTMNCIQFCIESSTGVLRLEKPFDSSSQSEYIITVTATDSGSSCSTRSSCHKRMKSTDIKIILTAVNTKSPKFLNQICGKTISFNENNKIGQDITSLIVSDSDRGENGLITISFPSEELRTTVSGLRNTAYSQFFIEQLIQTNTSRVALLKTNEIFDYDKPGAIRVWYLFLLATDHGKPQRQAFCTLRINLRDVNDNAPVFVMTSWNYTIYRSSMNKFSKQFLRIIAWDADSDLNGKIYYYIGTPDIPYFSINHTTGTIILRESVHSLANLNSSYFPVRFYVYAQDRGTPQLLSKNNATVTIYLDDSDVKSAARWLDARYEDLSISIPEKFYERYPNKQIFDFDNGFNGSILYELTSQASSIMTVSSPFSDNANIPFGDALVIRNGQIFSSGITVTSGLHAEIQDLYLLYIRVLVNPPLIGSITIKIKDENDQIPTFDIRSIVVSVIEKEHGNRTIAQIQAFDRDLDSRNSYVQYRLNQRLSDTDAIGKFHVESDGTIWTNTIFGEETNKTFYRLFITAYNDVPAWNSQIQNSQDFQFDIQVIGINDKRPVFTNGFRLIEILLSETTVMGTSILNLTIVDLDVNTNLNLGILNGNFQNTFIFTFLSDNSANTTRTQYEAVGQLKLIRPLDYELMSEYRLVLFAFDTKNIATINITVRIHPQNTKAPQFDVMSGFKSYQYEVFEVTEYSKLDGHLIHAIDPDTPKTNLIYELYDNRHPSDLHTLSLYEINNQIAIRINSPGLSRDLPFGRSLYNFGIRVTDENGFGVSSYMPVSIKVIDTNNKGPIPTNSPWILNEGKNPSIEIIFEDYDDPDQDNTIPYSVKIVSPSSVELIGPTTDFRGSYELVYNGILNRTLIKNLTVTFDANDNKGFHQISSIPIIVRDQFNIYPISNGSKTINVIYVNTYQNSLRNIDLGSIYVNDKNDWYRADRIYQIRNVSRRQTFNVSYGILSTPEVLDPGSFTVEIDVVKSNIQSYASSTTHLEIENIDSEYVRQAATIRIQGEYPETLIDPILGRPLDKLRKALASFLSININSIKILTIRRVFEYRNRYNLPKPFELDKNEALTDVIFYVPGFYQFEIEHVLNANLNLFQSRFQIKAVASGPNPCKAYLCPKGTKCRPTRTIGPKPFTIDTNLTSFVGINILDSADCINAASIVELIDRPNECKTSTYNNLTYCASMSLLQYGPIGPCCQILGRTFDEDTGGYAVYAGTRFSNIAPARFSFDFIVRSKIVSSLILYYGPNLEVRNNFFWTAIEISENKLRFRFQNDTLITDDSILNSSIWYHVECQFIDSIVIVSVNDKQYYLELTNTPSNAYDVSNFKLYLGGYPLPSSRASSKRYLSLTSINTFRGCIRNVLSNGYYLDMSKHISSIHSNYGECSCSITNSCITRNRQSDIIIPWYTWLILVLVLLLLTTTILIMMLIFTRKKLKLKTLPKVYTDDTRVNVAEDREPDGEEDHSRYNLHILKKPVFNLSDGNTTYSNHPSHHTDSRIYYRPALNKYIQTKINDQIIPYANDTQLRYQYEGEGSIASNLSSIESASIHSNNYYHRFFPSFDQKL